jgi:SAM-dependent methyltransferase
MRSRKTIGTTLFLLFLVVGVQLQEAQVLDVLQTQTQTQPKKEKDVPYVSTPPEVVEAMLKMANVQSSDIVYDLGCGDGRIVVTAAEKFGAHGVGIDIDPVRIKEAWENAEKAGVGDRVKFIERDLFEADIKDATVVTLYLLQRVNLRLRPKLLAELKPGTRIVSNTFDMGDWKPEKTEQVFNRTLYMWTVPEGGKIPEAPQK